MFKFDDDEFKMNDKVICSMMNENHFIPILICSIKLFETVK